MRSSRLPVVKTLDEFDFSFQPSVKGEPIESLHELGFIERKENAVFSDSTSTRKLMRYIRQYSRAPKPVKWSIAIPPIGSLWIHVLQSTTPCHLLHPEVLMFRVISSSFRVL